MLKRCKRFVLKSARHTHIFRGNIVAVVRPASNMQHELLLLQLLQLLLLPLRCLLKMYLL